MKILCAFLICFTILAQGAVRTLTDKEISAGLVGTWQNSPSELSRVHDIATYNADGHGFELVWLGDQPESAAMRFGTTWSVTNNILTIICIESSNPQFAPVGLHLEDHIISMSQDQFAYEPIVYGGGKPHVKVRTPKSD